MTCLILVVAQSVNIKQAEGDMNEPDIGSTGLIFSGTCFASVSRVLSVFAPSLNENTLIVWS